MLCMYTISKLNGEHCMWKNWDITCKVHKEVIS